MSQELELLTEIRDLLRVMAEPALAERDASLRAALRRIVGTGKNNAKAAFLMDGSRSRSVIARETSIDPGNLSRFVKKLADAELIAPDEPQPRLLIAIPANFFDKGAS